MFSRSIRTREHGFADDLISVGDRRHARHISVRRGGVVSRAICGAGSIVTDNI